MSTLCIFTGRVFNKEHRNREDSTVAQQGVSMTSRASKDEAFTGHGAGNAVMSHPTPSLPPSVQEDDSRVLILLQAELDQLKSALQARDDFIAIAAHELRNPMTPLLCLSHLALNAARKAEPPVPPSLLSLLERMSLSIQDFVDRATRLLDVSRINAGNLQLCPAEADLSTILHTIVAKYENPLLRKGCPLEVNIEPGVKAWLDPLAFTQIVENLLSNAFKFGNSQTVDLCLARTEDGVTLSVADFGIGISAEQQRHIFGRFEQATTPPLGGGIGIGLWLTGRLVAAMKGRITVVSHPGQGATFTVQLPRRPNQE
jgi:two-component system, OmpR family, sensor kinase